MMSWRLDIAKLPSSGRFKVYWRTDDDPRCYPALGQPRIGFDTIRGASRFAFTCPVHPRLTPTGGRLLPASAFDICRSCGQAMPASLTSPSKSRGRRKR
jgi:hypothetical protein